MISSPIPIKLAMMKMKKRKIRDNSTTYITLNTKSVTRQYAGSKMSLAVTLDLAFRSNKIEAFCTFFIKTQ